MSFPTRCRQTLPLFPFIDSPIHPHTCFHFPHLLCSYLNFPPTPPSPAPHRIISHSLYSPVYSFVLGRILMLPSVLPLSVCSCSEDMLPVWFGPSFMSLLGCFFSVHMASASSLFIPQSPLSCCQIDTEIKTYGSCQWLSSLVMKTLPELFQFFLHRQRWMWNGHIPVPRHKLPFVINLGLFL